MDSNLPVDLLHWSLAILPLILLLVMLVGLRWSGGISGWIAMALATIVGFFMFQAPLDNLAVGFGKGLWEAFFILLVVWPALMLYQATSETGAFKVIRKDIQEHSQNQLFLVLGFGFVFASFLQGVAGFGVPIAVVAPLLVGIGVKPVMAIVIPLIGHAWANMFGTLGVGWIATVNAVQIEEQTLTLVYTGILLWIVNIIGGLMVSWLYGKWKAVKEGFLAVVIISVIHGGGQLGILFFDPILSTFIATIVAFGALFALSKMKRYSERAEADDKTEVMKEEEEDDQEKTPNISLHQAFMPYYFLTISTVLMLGIPPVTDFLEQFEIGPPFPAVETGYGFEMEAEEAYSPIAPFTHPGFFLLISFIFAYFWYRRFNLYKNISNPIKKILSGTNDNALGATLAISGFLTMSMIMENSGQTDRKSTRLNSSHVATAYA